MARDGDGAFATVLVVRVAALIDGARRRREKHDDQEREHDENASHTTKLRPRAPPAT